MTLNKIADVFTIDLPYWAGVLVKPVLNVRVIPFSIQKDENGSYKQVNPETIEKMITSYASDEYAHITTPPGESTWANSLTDKNLEYLRKNEILKGKKVIDIGGTNSYIADILFKEDGIDSYTLINPNLQEGNEKKSKINFIKGYFPEDLEVNSKFDVVLLFNCLEHVPDPTVFLRQINNILTDDGILILKTSDDSNLLSNGDFNVFLHEHLYYFTPESFARMTQKAGLEIVNSYLENDSILAVLKNSTKSNFEYTFRTPIFDFSIFNEQLNYAKELFQNLYKNKTHFIFHGACLGLVTLCHLLKDHVDISEIQVVDIDEKKNCKYLPGFKKRILLPDEVRSEDIELVIVGSATFITSIKNYWTTRGVNESNVVTMYKTQI